MARFADYPSVEDERALKDLLTELRRLKPRRWSVILGDRELVLRPGDRQNGKVSLTVSALPHSLSATFFSPALGIWAGSTVFPLEAASAPPVLDWANEQVGLEEQRR